MKQKFIIRNILLGILSFVLINTANAATGGPDTFGYTYMDSNSGATYSWVSHTGSATTVSGRGDDTLYGSYSLGFTFNFYGNDYSSFYICNNGFVTFSSGNCAYTNADIVTAAVPNNFIAPFWDDLYTAGTIQYELFGSAPNQYMVITFDSINHINAQAGTATFQVILYETSNQILLQYSDVDLGNVSYDSGASATVGIENSDGTDGLQYSYNSSSLSSSLAIEFDPPSGELSVTQSAYRIFNNNNGTDVGAAMAVAGSPATLAGTNQQFRVRMLLHIAGSALAQSTGSYKLQYVGKGNGSCSVPTSGTPSSWTDVTTLTDIAFYDNASPTDGSALTSNGGDPTHNSDTTVNQTYEEANNFSNSQAQIGIGQDGQWDFSLYNKTGTPDTSYCFRAVESDGTELDTYDTYPEIATKPTSGGPDAYGYSWNDSYGTGEAYSWNDISGTGTLITGRTDDGSTGPYDIGFNFSYYGNTKTQFYICNNGYISFANNCAYINTTIPNASTPNDYIAAFWDDLYTGGNVYYETTGSAPNRKLIVSFDGINPYSTQGNTLYFQIILHETTSRIKVQYKDVDLGTSGYGGGLSATVGIENLDGSDGLQYSYETASLEDNYAIDYTYGNLISFNQSAYRFFANNNGVSVGASLATQDTSYTLTSDGEEFRLRMLIQNMGTSLSTFGQYFKLQFVDKGVTSCASPSGTSPSSWTDITSSTALAYNDNATPNDGDALSSSDDDPTHSGDTINNQTYEELNDFTNSQSTIGASEDGLWDFSLYDKSSGDTTLCIRAVGNNGDEFTQYNSYPEITTLPSVNSITFSLINSSLSLGELTSTATTAGTSTTISVDSSAVNGFEVGMHGEGNGATAGLYNGSADYLITGAASSSIVTSGTPGFGIYIENASGGITIDEGFDNDSDTDLAISRIYQRLFSTTTPSETTLSADMRYKTVVNSIVPAGTYSELINIIVFGSF